MKRSLILILFSSAMFGQAIKTRPKPVTAKEVQQLREALAAQQQQMEVQRQQMDDLKAELRQVLDATQHANAAQQVQATAGQAQSTALQAQQAATEARTAADLAAANANEAKGSLALVNTRTQEQEKKLSALQDVLGRFRFNGDVRVRGESFFQDVPGFADRNRARIRVRFGFEGKLKGSGKTSVPIYLGPDDSGERERMKVGARIVLRVKNCRYEPAANRLQFEEIIVTSLEPGKTRP